MICGYHREGYRLFLCKQVIKDASFAEEVSFTADHGVLDGLQTEVALLKGPLGILADPFLISAVLILEHLLLSIGEHRVGCVVLGVAGHDTILSLKIIY